MVFKRNELLFISSMIISFFSWMVGLPISFFSIKLNNAFSIGLLFPVGIGLCLFSLLLIKFMHDLPLTVEQQKENRDIASEKTILRHFVRSSNILLLFSITLILFVSALLFSKLMPMMEIYMVAIASGAAGAFWGIGIQDASSFLQWSKYGKDFEKKYDWTDEIHADWYDSKETFLRNLLFWKKRFVYTFFSFVVIVSAVAMLLYEHII